MSFGKDFAQIPQTISCIELDTKRFLLFCPTSGFAFQRFAPYSSGWSLLPENALRELTPLDLGYDFFSPRLLSDGKELFLSGQICSEESPSYEELVCVPRLLHAQDGTLIQSPSPFLNEKREYRRLVTLYEGEKSDTFGVFFEAVINFNQDTFSFQLRDHVLIECDGTLLTVTIKEKKRSFNVESPTSVHVFSRRDAIEIFIDGKVFTSLLSDSGLGGIKINIGSCRADIYKLTHF